MWTHGDIPKSSTTTTTKTSNKNGLKLHRLKPDWWPNWHLFPEIRLKNCRQKNIKNQYPLKGQVPSPVLWLEELTQKLCAGMVPWSGRADDFQRPRGETHLPLWHKSMILCQPYHAPFVFFVLVSSCWCQSKNLREATKRAPKILRLATLLVVPPPCQWRFVCNEDQSWVPLFVAGCNIWWCWRMNCVAPRIANDVSHM